MRTLILLAAFATPMMASAQMHIVSTQTSLRAVPTPHGQVVVQLPTRSQVQLRNCDYADGAWCSVTFAGRKGYVEAKYLGPEQEAGTSSSARAAAPRANVAQQSATARQSLSAPAIVTPRGSAALSPYTRGPRGGCYTYSASGKKRYVDRSLC